MHRRTFLQSIAAGTLAAQAPPPATPPNIVLILADDLGYGDIGAYGSKIRTPNLDRMAHDGVLFRHFSSANPVCSPSRASLLTGRYGVRCGVPDVIQPSDPKGLALTETTLAQSLRGAGYRTMCIGKWHLGATSAYLPTARGFDSYFGIPYSNDNMPSVLLRNTEVIESPVTLETITQRYTEQARSFIQSAKDGPFFLYLPHTFPHIPLAASQSFAGKSPVGLYGDVVEELDWSVGQVLQEIDAQGLSQNTLVLFTSDNGPWFQGSPGRLRGRKGDTFEGGMREPFLARWLGKIPSGLHVHGFASMLDVFPTVTALTGAARPRLPLDGVNIWPMMTGEAEAVERPPFLYFSGYNLQCARLGRWKFHFSRFNGPAFAPAPAGGRLNLPLVTPELYDLELDSEESYNTAEANPMIVDDIRARVQAMLPGLPAEVRTAWNATASRPAAAVNAGEYPWLLP